MFTEYLCSIKPNDAIKKKTAIGIYKEANSRLVIFEGLFSKTPQKYFSLLEQFV